MLVERLELTQELGQELMNFLDEMVPMYIEARYPKYKQRVASTLNKQVCAYILEQTKKLHECLLQKF